MDIGRNTARALLALRTFSFGVLLHLATLVLPSKAVPPDSLLHFGDMIPEFEAFIKTGMSEYDVPGAAVAIVRKDKIVYLKGFGVREQGRPEPVDVHTVFRLSSLSKGFASALTGILVQDGILNWDDPVVNYLPNFALSDSAHTEELTIRNVLSHTTGLPPHAYTNLIEDNVPYERMVNQLRKVKLYCDAGDCFAYQNVIYSVVGDIIEVVTDQSYSDALKHSLFLPLGMYDASSTYEAFLSTENRASPHVRSWNKVEPVTVREAYYNVAPAAGVNACISDLAEWLRALVGARPDVVQKRTLDEISRPLIRTSKRRRYFRRWRRLRKTYYGLGWRVFDYSGVKLVYHGGYVRGFRSEIAFSPENQIGIVVLMNRANPLIGRCVPTFMNLYFRYQNSRSTP